MAIVVLGINHNSHDSAASLLVDGEPVAVAEEERFIRKKHAGDVPVHATRFCLERAGVQPRDIDHVYVSAGPGSFTVFASAQL